MLTKLKRDLNPAARSLELLSSTPIESENVSIAVNSLQILAAELQSIHSSYYARLERFPQNTVKTQLSGEHDLQLWNKDFRGKRTNLNYFKLDMDPKSGRN